MPGPADRHRRVAGAFADRVAGVRDWDAPTPVDAWAARDVVGHLVTWPRGFLAAGGVTLPDVPDVAADPVGAWRAHAEQVQELLESPRAAQDFAHPHAGTRPLGAVLEDFYVADVFMHTWDLARATGQDDALDAQYCAALLGGMRPIEDVLRASGQYGPAVPVPDDAPVQHRLLGFIGRDPAWRPPA